MRSSPCCYSLRQTRYPAPKKKADKPGADGALTPVETARYRQKGGFSDLQGVIGAQIRFKPVNQKGAISCSLKAIGSVLPISTKMEI